MPFLHSLDWCTSNLLLQHLSGGGPDTSVSTPNCDSTMCFFAPENPDGRSSKKRVEIGLEKRAEWEEGGGVLPRRPGLQVGTPGLEAIGLVWSQNSGAGLEKGRPKGASPGNGSLAGKKLTGRPRGSRQEQVWWLLELWPPGGSRAPSGNARLLGLFTSAKAASYRRGCAQGGEWVERRFLRGESWSWGGRVTWVAAL